MSADRFALVTGAAGGIGLEVARRLSARGYAILAVDRTPELAGSAAEAIPGAAVPVACDLSDRGAVLALAAQISGEWADQLEILVCNAGVVVPGDVGDVSHALIDRQLDVMLVSCLHLISAAAEGFRPRNRGHIMATVSMGGILALPGSAAYSAAKFGLRAYLAALHCELRTTGVNVSGIYPSAVDTPMLHHEATHGGSLLNFVGTVAPASQIADAYERALDRPRLEIYVPYSDSLLCRGFGSLPWLVPYVLAPFERLGQRGRRRYLATHGQEQLS